MLFFPRDFYSFSGRVDSELSAIAEHNAEQAGYAMHSLVVGKAGAALFCKGKSPVLRLTGYFAIPLGGFTNMYNL
jgi:hypothetical protein